MVLTGEQRFALRAKKALENGNDLFIPRGERNNAAFENMKAKFNKMKKQDSAGRGAQPRASRSVQRSVKRRCGEIQSNAASMKHLKKLVSLFLSFFSTLPRSQTLLDT